jgi:RNA polymerase sigma-70 factor, ECF subfamily
MSDARLKTLLAAAQEGSDSAWAEIYRELAPGLLGYLRVSGEPEPEDALGEVFLQVARDVGRFEGDWSSFRSWVFTIAHHRLIDAGRRRARRPVEVMAEPPEPRTTPVDQASEEALAKISAEEVHRVLGCLSESQRAVVLLRVIGDMSVEDVAKAIGKRSGAVKQLQRRGLAAVERELTNRGMTPVKRS